MYKFFDKSHIVAFFCKKKEGVRVAPKLSMSQAESTTTLLQPINLSFFERLNQEIDFSAINVNPSTTNITPETYSRKAFEKDVLVDMTTPTSRSFVRPMQLVPLSKMRRASMANDEMEEIPTVKPDAPVYSHWLSSLFMLLVVSPSLCNLLVVTALMAATYYYTAMFQISGLAVYPSFWDRTMWAIGCAALVYASYTIMDGICSLVERRALLQTFGSKLTSGNPSDMGLEPAWTITDFWTFIWRALIDNLTPYVLIANIAWFIHSTSRLIMKMLFYMSLAFYVTALLWSQMGVPYSVLPSRDSPVVGFFILAAEKLLGPVAMPISTAWTQSAYVMPTAPVTPNTAQQQYYANQARFEEFYA